MALYTYTPKLMTAGTALTASAATYYTSPASPGIGSIIKEIILCNTDTTARTVTLYIIPSGGAAGIANTILNAVALQPNETKVIPVSRVMTPGAFIQALASSAAVVSITISGIEVTTS